MTPATQEVYDAFNRVGLYNEPSFETDRRALAAAIREIAAKFSYEAYEGGWYELVVDAKDLYAIADELEPMTNGTQNLQSERTDGPLTL
jgi:hypothetical protein